MKYLKYILIINVLSLIGVLRIDACEPFYSDDPNYIKMFRCCSPELERQWQNGCRFLDYEKEQNCLLWQSITSMSIPVRDIEKVVYKARLSDLKDLSNGKLSDNKFAKWLSAPENNEDLEYIRSAKEIEEIREYMNDPWYYAYDGDDEHARLAELKKHCEAYNGKRHAARYTLQLVRLNFAVGEFADCINLWEDKVCNMPQTIVTDMIASYVGGAYSRTGNRDKAIELFTKSQDIGSLINLKAWEGTEQRSKYTDSRIKELEYIFNRFPNSPLLSVKLQEYVRKKESNASVSVWFYCDEDSLRAKKEAQFYNELIQFARNAIASPKCNQKGMWNYALGYMYYIDGDLDKASSYLYRAEQSQATPFMKESIKAFRFLMNAHYASNTKSYLNKLLADLTWLDEHMSNDVNLSAKDDWRYSQKLNWRVSYWPDVARKVLLGVICPKMLHAGNSTLALQLANYASNRIHQLVPLYEAYHSGYYDPDDKESYTVILPFDEYRQNWYDFNPFDYSNQFFDMINDVSASQAAKYADRIAQPINQLDRFLNEKGYIDTDYIFDIVGTLYLRDMDYEKAFQWLSKVSKGYQGRTNIAKEGYFRLDPFRYQFDKKNYIADSSDYKLNFTQEMLRLEKIVNSDSDQNRKANAKIRFAIGLRNSFGKCWYLTDYSYELVSDVRDWGRFSSTDREGFKGDAYAQKAYKRVDMLIKQALSEFTDPEQAAQAQLEMMNFATLMKKYPETKAAKSIRSRCDNYYDYALQRM